MIEEPEDTGDVKDVTQQDWSQQKNSSIFWNQIKSGTSSEQSNQDKIEKVDLTSNSEDSFSCFQIGYCGNNDLHIAFVDHQPKHGRIQLTQEEQCPLESKGFTDTEPLKRELANLKLMFGDRWRTDPYEPSKYCIDIIENGRFVTLTVTLPEDYPLLAAPNFNLSTPSLQYLQIQKLKEKLDDLYLFNGGTCILHMWIEKITDFLHQLPIENGISGKISILHGETVSDGNNSFQGHMARINSPEDVNYVLVTLKIEDPSSKADRTLYAYRIETVDFSAVQHFEDDGESDAGFRLLRLLQNLNITNILVVVTSWYINEISRQHKNELIHTAAEHVLRTGNIMPPVVKKVPTKEMSGAEAEADPEEEL